MDRVLRAYGRLLEALCCAAMATMVVMVFGNVVLRYAFNSGITVSEELSRWCFVWMTFLGAILGLQERAHLGTDVVTSRLGPRTRHACRLLAQTLMLGVTALLLQGSWVQARINLDVEAPVTGWSMAWLYGAGVVFGASALLVLGRGLWSQLRGLDDDAPLGRDSEELRP